MPILSDPREEKYAQGLAEGKEQKDAYAAAGWAPNTSHASRKANYPRIRERVAELQAAAAEKVVNRVAFDAISMFERLEADIQAAKAGGDFKAAITGRTFMLEAFGYRDHPTLTHEHVRQSQINIGQPGPVPPVEGAEATPPEAANLNRFGAIMRRYAKK